MRSVRFSTPDIDWFADASHDRSPLHVDDAHGRRSPFGGRVVHGVLGLLAQLAELPPRPNASLRRLVVEFQRPVFPEVSYEIHVDGVTETKDAFRLIDGSLVLARGMADFIHASPAATAAAEIHRVPRPMSSARSPSLEDLQSGVTLEVPYGITREAHAEIESRFRLGSRGVAPWQAVVLVGTSYVVGMHVPGERALFSRLQIDFVPDSTPHEGIVFECVTKSFDARLSVLRTTLRVRSGETIVATGELHAFVRREMPKAARPVRREPLLAGKLALVVGASRGLGASLAVALAERGAAVLGTFARSAAEADALVASSIDLPGSIEMLQGDAGNIEFCDRLRERLVSESRAIDFLFCNAAPALRPLWLDPSASERICEYVDASVRLCAMPLATFRGLVSRDGGWVVVTSSIAVRNAVAEWPHYIAAKSAIEGLVLAASKESPTTSFLIARPPALLTDFAPSLTSLHGALPPERVAEVVVSRLLGPAADGGVEVVEEF